HLRTSFPGRPAPARSQPSQQPGRRTLGSYSRPEEALRGHSSRKLPSRKAVFPDSISTVQVLSFLPFISRRVWVPGGRENRRIPSTSPATLSSTTSFPQGLAFTTRNPGTTAGVGVASAREGTDGAGGRACTGAAGASGGTAGGAGAT